MHESIQNLMEFFGLLPDTATMTLGDCFVYMVMAFLAVISIYLLYSFIYGIMNYFLNPGGRKI